MILAGAEVPALPCLTRLLMADTDGKRKHLGQAESLSGSLNISRPAGDVRADFVLHRQGRV